MDDFAKAAQLARQIKPFLRAMANAEEVISTAKGASEAISTLKTEVGKLTPKIKKLRADKDDLEKSISDLQEKHGGLDAEIVNRLVVFDKDFADKVEQSEQFHAARMVGLNGRYEKALVEHQENMDVLGAAEKSAMMKVRKAEKMLADLTKLGE